MLRGVFLLEHEKSGSSNELHAGIAKPHEVPRTISYGQANLEDPLCHRVFLAVAESTTTQLRILVAADEERSTECAGVFLAIRAERYSRNSEMTRRFGGV